MRKSNIEITRLPMWLRRMRTALIFLLMLFAAFGILYLLEATYKDLWANLFAAVVAALLIDTIVESSEMQKNERSTRYVKGYIANVCLQLMWRMKPPKDWQKRLNQTNSDWKEYFQIVFASREEAMNKLESVLGRYGHLIDTNLKNDVFDILNLLNGGSWTMPYLNIENKTDLMCLGWVIHDIVAVTNISFETLKKHRLMRCMGLSLRWKEGQPDIIDRPAIGDIGIQQNLSGFEEWLKELIEFRDELLKIKFLTR